MSYQLRLSDLQRQPHWGERPWKDRGQHDHHVAMFEHQIFLNSIEYG